MPPVRTKRVRLMVPRGLLADIDRLIQEGRFASRSEVFEEAARIVLSLDAARPAHRPRRG